MSGRDDSDSDSDSDAPEEFTSQQGILVDEEIRTVQKENKARVIREGKERRRRWTQRLTPREPKRDEQKDANEVATNEESEGQDTAGMLPSNIVQLLAAGEKRVFSSDSEDEKPVAKLRHRKKKSKSSRIETVILNDMPPPKCLQSSLDFLKKKKMQEVEQDFEESGGSSKKTRTTDEGEYSISSNPDTPVSGSSSMVRPMGKDAAKKREERKRLLWMTLLLKYENYE